MKILLSLLATLGVFALAQSTTPATVDVSQNEALGKFLVDADGMTLYLFTMDTKDSSNCYDDCAAAWPPLLTTDPAVAGKGVDASLLGTAARKDGATQVTYDGHPLYTWSKDKAPGDTTGQAVGDVWYVVSPAGETAK